jgi:hypothetical protein
MAVWKLKYGQFALAIRDVITQICGQPVRIELFTLANRTRF